MLTFIDIIILFLLGGFTGWTIEVLYRLFVSRKKLVNPGFLSGPYLPMYGTAMVLLTIISSMHIDLLPKLALLAITPTMLELMTGIIFINMFNIKLWDYSKNFLNYKGIISIQYSVSWALISLFYYLFVVKKTIVFVNFVQSWSYSLLIIGLIYGIFSVDLFNSLNIANMLRVVSKEIDKRKAGLIILNYQEFKKMVFAHLEKTKPNQILTKFMFSYYGAEAFVKYMGDKIKNIFINHNIKK